MYRRIFALCFSCIICLLSGCSAKSSAAEQMTDVVVIQNKSIETELQNANAPESAAGINAVTFVEDMNYDVKNFIRQFYDYSNLERDSFMELSGYIDSVKSLTCYMMDGMAEGSYIVVAKCGVLTTLGAQVITMLNAFYVCTNESGTYYICGSSVGDEVRSYNSIMLSDQIIEDVEKQVRLSNNAAEITQPNLKDLEGIVIFDDVTRFLYEKQPDE